MTGPSSYASAAQHSSVDPLTSSSHPYTNSSVTATFSTNALSTDPLPPPIDTSSSHSSGTEYLKRHPDTAVAEGTAAQLGAKQKEYQRRAKHLSLSTAKSSPYARPGDSPRFQAVLKDFDRVLKSLPIPIHHLVPKIVARLICRVFRSQNIMASNIAFDIALFFWRIIINLFFREIRPRSSWRVPTEGPVIFVAAPHHNQFLDPLLLASEVRRASGRRVAFLIAEKSIKRRFVGAAARIMQSIPVARAADSAKKGKGYISLHPSGDPLLLQGHGTSFKSQLVPKGQIMLPKACGHATAEVVEVISDTEVKIKKEFKDQRALDMLRGKVPQPDTTKTDKKARAAASRALENVTADLQEDQGCKYSCLPFVDQTQMYAKVYEKLAEGGCLGIFPEGGSHDRTDLLPLKAGVVIMALGAMSANRDLNVRIVPVGLSYFHPHKFRSRAVVEFGAPIDVPRELVGLFDQGGEGKRKAVGEMMDIVYDGLKGVTLRAPDFETLMVVQAGRRLYRAPGQSLSLGQTVELNRRFIMGYLQFKDEPRVVKLRDEILRYNKKLRYAGLKDHQVERATRAGWRSLGLLAYRLGLLGLWGGLALPGAVLNSPIIILAKIISHKKAKEALAASQVKVAGRDVLATWKILVSLGVAPVLYTFYAGFATYLAHRYQLSPRTKALMPLYTLIVLPTMSYSALKFAEVGIDIYKSLPPLFVSLIPGNHKVILDLQQTRAKISSDMHLLIDELAPQVWEDFAENRILPNAAAPPAPEREALMWKQKKSTSSASGDALSHPLQWMDERLFGWGRRRRSSTRRSMSADEIKNLRSSSVSREAAAGSAIEEEEEQGQNEELEGSWDDASEGSSYTESGEEDEGDYEAVFSMLNPSNLVNGLRNGVMSPGTPGSGGRRSRTHSRSRSGSRGSLGGSGETFAEKRNRSNQDLRALMREGGAMSPTATRSSGILDGVERRSSQSSRTSALPASLATTSISDGKTASAGEGGATARRNRSHSLSEDVHVNELKNVGPAAKKLPFTAASQALEMQHEGGAKQAGVLPKLEDMKSAEPTPPATPRHEAEKGLGAVKNGTKDSE